MITAFAIGMLSGALTIYIGIYSDIELCDYWPAALMTLLLVAFPTPRGKRPFMHCRQMQDYIISLYFIYIHVTISVLDDDTRDEREDTPSAHSITRLFRRGISAASLPLSFIDIT